MRILKKEKVCFVHIPKTGGTSIAAAIDMNLSGRSIIKDTSSSNTVRRVSMRAIGSKLPRKHDTALDAIIARPWLEEYHFFAVVRNPWSWIRSFYLFINHAKRSPDTGQKDWQHHLFPVVSTMSFERFVEWVVEENGLSNLSERKTSHFRSKSPVLQKDWLSKNNGELVESSIIRFENLAADFSNVCKNIGLSIDNLPRTNISAADPGEARVDSKIKNLIGDYFEEDIKYFGF